MNLKHLIFLLSLIAYVSVDGQLKTFVRDYTYRASDSDSKISSRQKALEEVKASLIEELGIYVTSYVNYEVEEINGKMTKDFFTNEIKTFSAGTTELKIIEEAWDGYNYYVQAEISADPEEVLRRINETLSVRKKSAVIDSLNALLKYSEVELNNKAGELEKVENELATTNAQLDNQKASFQEAKNELQSLRTQLAQYQREEQEVKDEIESIREKVLLKGTKARSFIRIGMTYDEVSNELGRDYRADVNLTLPTSDGWRTSRFYALGDIWFHIDESGLVGGVWPHEKMQLIIDASSKENRAYLMKKYNIGQKLY